LIKNSVCTYCGVGCEISAEIGDSGIEKVFATPEMEVSRGELCLKGKEGHGFLSSENRVRGAWVRENGKLVETSYEKAYDLVAEKLKEFAPKTASIGGARTSCESGYTFQKFSRETLNSPHVDNCARVCHSPSLRGMRETIGEGASTNPFRDIENSEFLLVFGSNTTEAHPIVANKILRAKIPFASFDIREIQMYKKAKYGVTIPYEANLLVLNMLARTILEEELYDKRFVETRTKYFEEYREQILNDPFADPMFFRRVAGYEYLAELLPKIAREYASKKSMILWGLGITENFDGSYAVMAITHLALLTGNVGKSGAGLMPLRGQNNVQGACDVGMLPYYAPDYQTPKEVGLMTPDIIDEVLKGEIKAIWNMGEDLAHIHANQNKVQKALQKLDFLVVNEVMFSEVTKFADVVFGVKSGYEKTGVYVNAERRLHLSQPLVESDMPDDWEVIAEVEKRISGEWNYTSSVEIWNEAREEISRYKGASYERLEENRISGLQWPVGESETPILHLENFRTKDGLGRFKYHQYKLRGQIEELLSGEQNSFYLSTGRSIIHYNNASQTRGTERLQKLHSEDTLFASVEDKRRVGEVVKLKTEYGESAELKVKFTKKLKKGTLFTTFHHPKSRINFLFGDEGDELIKTSQFKSIKVTINNS
jgi:formate dehydrogenase major subunit